MGWDVYDIKQSNVLSSCTMKRKKEVFEVDSPQLNIRI